MTQRVAITGMGLISAVGNTVAESWERICNGVSGIDRITLFDTTDYDIKLAGEVKHWNATDFLPAKELRRRDRYQWFGHVALQEAVQHAQLNWMSEAEQQRTAILVSSAFGGMTSFTEQVHNITNNGSHKMPAFGIPSFMTTGASVLGSIEWGIQGQSYTLTSACATGSDSIGHAFDLIRLGRYDTILAGAAEAPILPNSIAGFQSLRAASTQHDPIGAVRPFDRHRSGLVASEGAAVVVLESLSHAQQRGATIYAELVGYGASSDAYHIVAPHPDGRGAVLAMERALADAQLVPEQIDYINAHGTATPLNDPMESLAIQRVFKDHAWRLPISSTKSMTGHAMGMSGAMELVFCVQAIQAKIIPPTINHDEPDPACPLDYVAWEARPRTLTHVMSNAFGFGGHNSVLIIKAYQGD